MIVRAFLVALVAAAMLVGCTPPASSHDVPPPGGLPKLRVPKVDQRKSVDTGTTTTS